MQRTGQRQQREWVVREWAASGAVPRSPADDRADGSWGAAADVKSGEGWLAGYRDRLHSLARLAQTTLDEMRHQNQEGGRGDVIPPPPVEDDEAGPQGVLATLINTLEDAHLTPEWASRGGTARDENQVPPAVAKEFTALYRGAWFGAERDALMRRLVIGSLTDAEVRSGRDRDAAEVDPVSWDALVSIWEVRGQ